MAILLTTIKVQLQENQKDFENRMSESSQRSHKVLKDLRSDHESKMSELKNKIKSLQLEPDMEWNLMSAQEEM